MNSRQRRKLARERTHYNAKERAEMVKLFPDMNVQFVGRATSLTLSTGPGEEREVVLGPGFLAIGIPRAR